jgi:hypothetical protein
VLFASDPERAAALADAVVQRLAALPELLAGW